MLSHLTLYWFQGHTTCNHAHQINGICQALHHSDILLWCSYSKMRGHSEKEIEKSRQEGSAATSGANKETTVEIFLFEKEWAQWSKYND